MVSAEPQPVQAEARFPVELRIRPRLPVLTFQILRQMAVSEAALQSGECRMVLVERVAQVPVRQPRWLDTQQVQLVIGVAPEPLLQLHALGLSGPVAPQPAD